MRHASRHVTGSLAAAGALAAMLACGTDSSTGADGSISTDASSPGPTDGATHDAMVADGPVDCQGDADCCSKQPRTLWVDCSKPIDGGTCHGSPPFFGDAGVDPDAAFVEGCRLTMGCQVCFCGSSDPNAWVCPL